MRTDSAALFLLAGLTCLISCGSKTDPEPGQPLATVCGESIDLETFQQDYADFLDFTSLKDNLMNRNVYLKSEVDRIILAEYADTSGFSDIPEVQQGVQAAVGQLMLNKFYEKEIAENTEVPEINIREAFRRSKIQIHARHLFARSMEDANELIHRLENGETFEQLAREVFQDPMLADTGGDLGYFTYDQMEPAFEDAAYQLQDGQISKPVKTNHGYSIIQVLDRTTELFITEKDYLYHREDFEVTERARQLKTVVKSYTESLVALMDLVISDDHLRRLFDNRDIIFTEPMQTLLTNKTLSPIHVTSRFVDWNFADIIGRLKLTRDVQQTQIKTVDDMYQVLTGLIAREEILNRVNQSDWIDSPEFLAEKDRVKRQRILKMLVGQIYGVDPGEISTDEKRNRYASFISGLKARADVQVDKEVLESFRM